MTISTQKLIKLRKEQGWSQEKLAVMSGLSERTIQRIEKNGACSLESLSALAQTFNITPNQLKPDEALPPQTITQIIDYSGAFSLFILGLLIPTIVLLTGTNGPWELASFALVMLISITFTAMSYGFKSIYHLLNNTSWLVRYPSFAPKLENMIVQAGALIRNAYITGVIASIVAATTLLVHQPQMTDNMPLFLAIICRPLIYAMLFMEFWIRPYQRKMKRMLADQQDL